MSKIHVILFSIVAFVSAVALADFNCKIVSETDETTVTVGEECNPIDDCKQCGYCDKYLYCNDTTNRWTLETCQQIVQSDGSILVKDKLFWKVGDASDLGGHCSLWEHLGPENATYRADPTCKEICVVEGDVSNVRRFHYTDPNFAAGIWKAVPKPFCCEEGTQFDQDARQCVLCKVPNTCNVACT